MTVKVWSLMYMVRDILDLHGVGGQGVRASEEFPGAGLQLQMAGREGEREVSE